jgi:anti-anti-sigma regulatory factor
VNRLRLHIHPGPVFGVEVSGDLCISSAPIFEACLRRLVALHPSQRLLLDLRGVTFCDLTALRSLWRVRDAAREAGVDLDVCGSPAVAHLEALLTGLAAPHAA